ncbi:MAG: T9SS type A sorting domain-containing protein [Bacteroidia bacterium]
MKKLKTAVAVMLLSLGLNAQQFVYEYGNASRDQATDLAKISTGYLLAGNQSTGIGAGELILIRIGEDGFPPNASFFSRQYQLLSSNSIQARVNNTQVAGLPGGEILAVGSFTQNAGNGVFVARLSSSGTVISTSTFFTVEGTGSPSVRALQISFNGSTAFVCGTTDDPNIAGARIDFAFSFDLASSTLNWSLFYDNEGSTNEELVDMIRSNFADELIMVGNMTTSSGEEIYFRKISPADGLIIAAQQRSVRSSNPNLPIRVAAIASNGNEEDQRFLICGHQQTTNARRDVMVMAISTDFTTVDFTRIIPFSTNTSFEGNDIFVAVGQNSQVEIIVSTQINVGAVGGRDMGVLRLSLLGVPINHATFGSVIADETPVEMVLDNDGFGVLGSTTRSSQGASTNTNAQLFLVKTNLQGLSECNSPQTALTSSALNTINIIRSAAVSGGLVISSGSLSANLPVAQLNVCTVDRLPAPSNPEETPLTSSIAVSPNPVSSFSDQLTVNLNLLQPDKISYRILDVQGREVYTMNQTLPEGSSQVILALPQDLPTGIYIINIVGEFVNHTERVIIE